jgi:choice-of-anchor C domain-containing protein
VVASIVLAGSALAFAGLNNGGFENGTYTGGTYQNLVAGTGSATTIPGWTVTAGDIDWIQGHWISQTGARSVDLSGWNAGAISQTFPTTIGNTYFVAFYLAGNAGAGPTIKHLTVSATGAAPASYTFDTTGHTYSAMGWTLKGYSFLATSLSSTLTFTSTDATNAGPALDNVVVTETAPTGAACKKGGWEKMIDTSGNRFKNQGDCVSFYATDGKNLGAVTP